jgi:hypothetical protein
MPLDPRVREARMFVTLALLKVAAAQTFVELSREPPRLRGLLAPLSHPAAWPHVGVARRPRPGGLSARSSGGGRTS